MAVATEVKVGKVVQIIGPVVDIEFARGTFPLIYNAVRIIEAKAGIRSTSSCEVEQHLGENRVRSRDGGDRRHAARDEGGRHRARSRCRSAPRRWAA